MPAVLALPTATGQYTTGSQAPVYRDTSPRSGKPSVPGSSEAGRSAARFHPKSSLDPRIGQVRSLHWARRYWPASPADVDRRGLGAARRGMAGALLLDQCCPSAARNSHHAGNLDARLLRSLPIDYRMPAHRECEFIFLTGKVNINRNWNAPGDDNRQNPGPRTT